MELANAMKLIEEFHCLRGAIEAYKQVIELDLDHDEIASVAALMVARLEQVRQESRAIREQLKMIKPRRGGTAEFDKQQ